MKKLACFSLALLCLWSLAACGTPNNDEKIQDDAAQSQLPPEPTQEEREIAAAEAYVDKLPLESQVAQMFFVRCPEVDAAGLAGQYAIGGYVLFGRDFEQQTKESVQQKLASYQQAASVPMLIGVDEEGGTVVRVSANPNLREGRFRSPQALFAEGGLNRIRDDTAEKDALLASLGINVNLAPVCDISTNAGDFIYARSFGKDAAQTGEFVRTVVQQMREDKIGMVLKHFPGYGSNVDTHTGIAVDGRPIENFRESDFVPFQVGMEAGAQSVLVSHNVVKSMDAALPASLSPAVHQILREELGFDGVIMTDDLIMDAITQYTGGANAAVLAVQAGNDMLISSDFMTQYPAVLAAVQSGEISAEQVRASAVRVVRWKLALGLIPAEE